MLEFVRRIRPLLDSAARARIALSVVVSVLLAALEATALVMVLPLIEAINGISSGEIPQSARWMADRIAGPTPSRVAAALGLLTFTLFLVKGISTIVFLRWDFGFLMRAEASAARQVFAAYMRAPYSFHLKRNSAELQRTLQTSLRRVFRDSLGGSMGAIADLTMITGVGLVLLLHEPVAAVATLGYFAAVAAGYQRLVHGRLRNVGDSLQTETARSYQLVQQGLGAVKELAMTGRHTFFIDELYQVESRSASRLATMLLLGQAPRYLLEVALLAGAGIFSVFLLGTEDPERAVATIGLFLAGGLRVVPSLNRVLVAVAGIRTGLPALRQISEDLELLEQTPDDRAEVEDSVDNEDEDHVDNEGNARRALRLDHVSLLFEDRGPVLRDVSLTIEPGELLGLVGASGSGKTTLVDVMLGLLEPGGGRVLLGDRPIEGHLRSEWQRAIGYVPQTVVLVDDTVRANIAFGYRPEDVDEAALQRAVELAQLDDVLTALPEGLNTPVGENGVRLSGGQRQRIGIARALYRRPAMLVLDEATSALDVEAEAKVAAAVTAFQGEITVILVAHRLTMLRDCPRLVFVKDGAVAAEGTFGELLERSPDFARFVELSELPSAAPSVAEEDGR